MDINTLSKSIEHENSDMEFLYSSLSSLCSVGEAGLKNQNPASMALIWSHSTSHMYEITIIVALLKYTFFHFVM